MLERFDMSQIYVRPDGSYVINRGTYHVPNESFWKQLWNEVHDYAEQHPELVSPEPEPSLPSLEDKKAAKLAEINAAYEETVSCLVATYPETELLTFDKQETEARACLVDPEAETPLIDALAAGRGMDKAELVSRIIKKADAFAVAVGSLTGQRQKFEDLLNSAGSPEELAAITPVYALPEGLAL